MAIDLTKKRMQIQKAALLNAALGIILLAVFIILWRMLITPQRSTLKKIEAKTLSVSNTDEKKLLSLNQEKESLLKEKNIISNQVVSFKNNLRQEKDISSLLDKLILTAKKRKLEFTYVKPLPKKDITLQKEGLTVNLKKIPTSLELEAGFFEFLGFLWETENIEQSLKISSLSVENNPRNPQRHIEKLTLNTYQLVENKKGEQ